MSKLFNQMWEQFRRIRSRRQHIGRIYYTRLLKAAAFVSIVPALAIFLLVFLDKLNFLEGIFAILLVLFGSTFFVRPYLEDIASLTRYVNKLALDRSTSMPPLNFVSNIGELSSAVKHLHASWEDRRMQLQTALIESRILFDTLPDILLMMRSDLSILRVNNAAFEAFDKHIIGKGLSEVITDSDLIFAAEEVLHQNHPHSMELMLSLHGLPHHFRVELRHIPIRYEQGIALLIVMQDVTDSKRSKQMMKDFIANASHEIRTPLTSITGFIETLQNLTEDEEEVRQKFLSIMAKQAELMNNLVENLLSLSKIESRENTLPNELVNMNDIIQDAIAKSEWLAGKKNMAIAYRSKKTLPKIIGDTGELSQVVTNLLGNAIKYGYADSKIKIATEIAKCPPNNKRTDVKYLSISVTNQGEGIAIEHIPHVTERFYRVDKVRSRQIGGSGLGLAIVKHILNRHRGDMSVQSEEGKETCFTIYLPILKSDKQLHAWGQD